MGWKRWVAACSLAVVAGVGLGAVHSGVVGSGPPQARSATGAAAGPGLPAPQEDLRPRTVGVKSAARAEAAPPAAHSKPANEQPAKVEPAKADKPPRSVGDEAADQDEKDDKDDTEDKDDDKEDKEDKEDKGHGGDDD